MSTPQPSLIVFDFDDTLADTERHMLAAFDTRVSELLHTHTNLPVAEIASKNLYMYRTYGSGLHGWAKELGKDMDWVLMMFREVAPIIREAARPHLAPDPALLSRLQTLKNAGHTLAILTLGHRDYCLPLIKLLGLDAFFPDDMVFDISVMEGRTKRYESTFQYLLQTHLPAKFQHMYMFEDSMANLMAAKKAGFHTILVGPTRPPEELAPSIDHHSSTITAAIDYLFTQLPA